MKIKFFINIILVLLFSSILLGEEPLSETADKAVKIEEYKNFTGQWYLNINKNETDRFIKTYSTDIKDIISLNGKNYKNKKKIFVPFSDIYLNYIKSREKNSGDVENNEFMWPIEKVDRITSSFGRRWNMFHEGIDIPAARGIPIMAASNGHVVFAKFSENYGNAIFIEHRNNRFTRYCHASQVLVKDGEMVKKGQVIGYVGSTGNSTGNHLHFEIRYGDFPLNPLDFLPFNPNVIKTQNIIKPE